MICGVYLAAFLSLMVVLGLLSICGALASAAPASNADPSHAIKSSVDEPGPWFARVGILDALYDSGARITTNGSLTQGASARVSNSATVIVDVGYDVDENLSVLFMAGFPPKPGITGEGTVSGLKTLGKVRYGPAILTGTYRIRDWGAFQPYAGLGVAYVIIVRPRDGSVLDLGVHNNFGFVLQAGVEYPLDETWGLFADGPSTRRVTSQVTPAWLPV